MANGNYICPVCGTNLRWESDFMRSEVGLVSENYDDCGEDDPDNDGVVGLWNCPNCHVHLEIYFPTPNEEKEFNTGYCTEDE